MTDQEIIDIVNSALIDEFELEAAELTPEAHIYEDLELDSLDAVDMVIVLEKAFKFKIREEQSVKDVRTLGDLYNFIITKFRAVESGAA